MLKPEDGRDSDERNSRKMAPDHDEQINSIISELSEQLQEPLLKSSIRMVIIISLVHNKRLSFTELSKLTFSGKGSLSNHISKLEERGLIRTYCAFGVGGPRSMLTITDLGLKVYNNYANLLKKIFL
ncbi:MAG: transcriptional regulator [Cuniculiplasma sp.]